MSILSPNSLIFSSVTNREAVSSLSHNEPGAIMQRYITIILLAAYSHYLLPPCIADETVITGSVSAVSGDEITLDRGADSSVREGAKGVVYYQRTVGSESVRLTVARVRVVEVSSGAARLSVVERTAETRTGYRVDIHVLSAHQKSN